MPLACSAALLFAMALLFAAEPAGAQLPPSKGAPKVGEKMPDFTLPDTNNKPVKLSALLAPAAEEKPGAGEKPAAGEKPGAGEKPATEEKKDQAGSWVVLIFYRGYW
ncbi:MAG TPA: hypothetical protein VGR03_12240 [Candidatus Acidoferrum sp.]|nr:hypothetical protein [Candidatus Acidoferrum sp.]